MSEGRVAGADTSVLVRFSPEGIGCAQEFLCRRDGETEQPERVVGSGDDCGNVDEIWFWGTDKGLAFRFLSHSEAHAERVNHAYMPKWDERSHLPWAVVLGADEKLLQERECRRADAILRAEQSVGSSARPKASIPCPLPPPRHARAPVDSQEAFEQLERRGLA